MFYPGYYTDGLTSDTLLSGFPQKFSYYEGVLCEFGSFPGGDWDIFMECLAEQRQYFALFLLCKVFGVVA
jgi:hypothetical protein